MLAALCPSTGEPQATTTTTTAAAGPGRTCVYTVSQDTGALGPRYIDRTAVEGRSKVVSVNRNARRFHPSMFDYAMEREPSESGHAAAEASSESTHPAFFGYRKDKEVTLSRAAAMSRHFSIDTNPRLLLSFGPMVDAIIASGVSSYIEFVSIEGLYYLQADSKGIPKICSVPSSKADVFKSKLLGALEKRSLMKLLQTAVSYGNSLRGMDVTDQREAILAKGRALHQPQNASSEVVAAINLENERLEEQSFLAFMEKHKMPEHLRNVVLYSMCMSRTAECTAAAGLEFLYRHIYACGRLGETAFLYPHYGTSEVPESFCRSAAVHGAVYALRQTVTSVAVREPRVVDNSAEGANAEVVPASDPSNAEASSPRAAEDESVAAAATPGPPKPRSVALMLGSKQVITCDYLISNVKNFRPIALGTSPSAIEPSIISVKRWNVLRVSVCTGEMVLPVGKGVAVLPPKLAGLDNKYPVTVVQFNSAAMVCPAGTFIIYTLTAIDSGDDVDAMAVSESNKISTYLRRINESEKGYDELYFATSIEPLSAEAGSGAIRADINSINENIMIRDIGLNRSSVVSDDIMKEVTALFRRVCPGDEFFGAPAVSNDIPIEHEAADYDAVAAETEEAVARETEPASPPPESAS